MTQPRRKAANDATDPVNGADAVVDQPPESDGATQRVYRGIMLALENRELVLGQRLLEGELAEQFGVGRSAVREAMQRLAARGIVDLSRHRSASIRQLDLAETLEVLEVGEAMGSLVGRLAAERYDRKLHRALLAEAMIALEEADEQQDPGSFSRARRGFYRALLQIGGNRELARLFPAVGLHVVHAKYQIAKLQGLRLAEYRAIKAAVAGRDPARAETACREHVRKIRDAVQEQAQRR